MVAIIVPELIAKICMSVVKRKELVRHIQPNEKMGLGIDVDDEKMKTYAKP